MCFQIHCNFEFHQTWFSQALIPSAYLMVIMFIFFRPLYCKAGLKALKENAMKQTRQELKLKGVEVICFSVFLLQEVSLFCFLSCSLEMYFCRYFGNHLSKLLNVFTCRQLQGLREELYKSKSILEKELSSLRENNQVTLRMC